jgi:hypothetical protein
VQNLIKTARSPDNTPVTSAGQLDDQDIKKALLDEVNKIVGFDYNKIVDIVDPTAGNNSGKEMAQTVQDGMTKALDTIVSTEIAGTPAAIKQQDQYWLMLSQNVQSIKSMSQFNRANGSAIITARSRPTSAAAQQVIKQSGLEPEQITALQQMVADNGGVLPPGVKEILGAK